MASDKQRKLVSEALKEFEEKGGKIEKVKPGRAKGLKNQVIEPGRRGSPGVRVSLRGGNVISIDGPPLTDTEKKQRQNLRNLRNKTVTEKKEVKGKRGWGKAYLREVEAKKKKLAEDAKKKKAEDAKKKRNQQNKVVKSSNKASLPGPLGKVASRAAKEGWIDELISGAGKYSGLIKKWWNQQQKGTSVVPVKSKPKKSGTGVVSVRKKPTKTSQAARERRDQKVSVPGRKQPTKTSQAARERIDQKPWGTAKKPQPKVPVSRTKLDTTLKTGKPLKVNPKDLALKTGLATIGGAIAGHEATKPKKSPLSKVTPPRKPTKGYKPPFKMEDPTWSKPKPRVDTFKDMPKKKKKPTKTSQEAKERKGQKTAQGRYRYYGKPGETIGDLSRKFEIKYDTRPPGSLPHEEGYVDSNKRGGQIKGYKKGGKVSRPRGVGKALRGWGKAMR